MKVYLQPLIVALVLQACEPSSSVELGETLRHTNGLVATAPTGFETRETNAGYIFTEAGALRSPRQIRIELVSSVPDLPGARQQDLGGESVAYFIRELGSGSGGTEYELTATRAADSWYLVLSAIDQSETGQPEFAAAWATLEHAAVE